MQSTSENLTQAGQPSGLSVIAGSALISIYKDGWTGGIQLSIGDRNGGYRIAGPKFNGSGKPLLEHRLTERDAKEIRYYLDRAFPQNIPATRSGGLVGSAPSREDLLADYRLTIGQILMTPGWNAAAHAVLGARCAAIRAQLGPPKRTPNTVHEPTATARISK